MFNFFKKKKNNDNDELSKLKEELISDALKLSRDCNLNLDFSIESIKRVENVLDLMHKNYLKTKEDEGIVGLSFIYGAYIIAVIEKNVKVGKWEKDHNIMGENSFPYYLKENDVIFPIAWCQKRIFDGEQDNIWTKFKLFVLDKNHEN